MQMLPKIEQFSKLYNFSAIVPLSAKTGAQVENLHKELKQFLPESPHLFPDDQSSDRSVRFLCAELIREKIFRLCDQELPYSAAVNIESFVENDRLVKIAALILVDKESHKRMIIGEKGVKLKDISTRARIDIEKLVD